MTRITDCPDDSYKEYATESKARELFTESDECRQPRAGEFFWSEPNRISVFLKITDECLPLETDERVIAIPKEVMTEEGKTDSEGPVQDERVYKTQWYVSEDSTLTPYAPTPDENAWTGEDEIITRMNAIQRGKYWAVDGHHKTTRVVRVDPDTAEIVETVWMSVWDRQEESRPPAPGQPGESLKLIVWAPRDWAPPDHWGWLYMMQNVGLNNSNQWELIYARQIDRRGREVCWSIRFNVWHTGEPVMEWDWSEILSLTPDKFELVRAVPVDARVFPDSVATIKCVHCEKKVEEARAWQAYDPDEDEGGYYCSCWCADEKLGDEGYGWRADPDGVETEDPGCPVAREKVHAA